MVLDPGSGKNLFWIPDLGVKNSPDYRSGYATLTFMLYSVQTWLMRARWEVWKEFFWVSFSKSQFCFVLVFCRKICGLNNFSFLCSEYRSRLVRKFRYRTKSSLQRNEKLCPLAVGPGWPAGGFKGGERFSRRRRHCPAAATCQREAEYGEFQKDCLTRLIGLLMT